MLTAYSRVTVVTPDRRVDLALPSALPLSEVLPQLMRFVAPDGVDGVPATWALGKVGGASLALSQTLAEAGVLDGDVLELRAGQDEVRPAVVEDVRDAVEDSVDASGGVWTTRTTASFAVVTASIVLGSLALAILAAAGVGGESWLDRAGSPGVALAVGAGLLFAAWWSAGYATERDAQYAAGAAMLEGGVAGVGLASAGDATGWALVAAGVVGLAVVGGLARVLTPAATGHAAFGVVVAVSALAVAVVEALGVSGGQAVRVVPVLALLAVAVLPRVSLSVGGLASADYRVRHVGRVDLVTLRSRYRASNALLVGSLAGVSVVVVAGGVLLELTERPWDQTLSLSIAVVAVLRSRLFSRTQHMVLLRLAGLAVLGFALTHDTIGHEDLLPWLALVPALALLAAIGLVSIPMSTITRARVKRTLNVVEFVAIVDLLVVACGALGVYGAMGGLVT